MALNPAGKYTSLGKILRRESCCIKGWSPKRKWLSHQLLFLKAQWKGLAITVVWWCGRWEGKGRLLGMCKSPRWPPWSRCGSPLAQMPEHIFLHLLRCVNWGKKDTRNLICFYSLIILSTRANALWAPSHCVFNSPSQCAQRSHFQDQPSSFLFTHRKQKG